VKNLLIFFSFLVSHGLLSQVLPTHPYPVLDTVIGWGAGADRDNFRTRIAAIDNQGNMIISGLYTGVTDMDPGPGTDFTQNSSGTGFYLQKLDKNGNYLWGRSWIENAFAIATAIEIDSLDNIYLGGYFVDNAFDVDPISSNFFINTDSIRGSVSRTGFVMKINPLGSQIWVKGIRGAQLESMTIRQSEIIIGGDFKGFIDTSLQVTNPQYYSTNHNNDGAGIYVMKIDATTGNKIDHVIIADTLIFGMSTRDIQIDKNGNYLLAGSMLSGSFDFDPSVNGIQREQTHLTNNQSYVLRLDSGFNYNGHMVLNAVSGNLFYKINIVDNNIWVAGRYWLYQNMDLDPGPGVLVPTSGASNNRIRGDFHLQLDQNFQLTRAFYFPLLWPEFNSPYILFKDSAVYVASTYAGEISLTPQANDKTILINNRTNQSLSDTYSFFVMKLDSRDSVEWVYHPQRFSNADTGRHRIGAMLWDGDDIVLVGNYAGTVDFNLSPDTTQLQTQGDWSNFVLRLKDCSAPAILPEVNRRYGVCDTFQLAGLTFPTQGWHTLSHIVTTKKGCDSLIANDSVFVFLDVPQLLNQGTYLEAVFADTLYGEWIDCATDSVVQRGGSRFYPQAIGDYTLAYTHPNAPDCADTLACENINQISLVEINPENWNIFPNPVQQKVQIAGPLHQLESIRILQINGQELLSLEPADELFLNNLAAGLYIIELKTTRSLSKMLLVKE
jgi:hypothetical protein